MNRKWLKYPVPSGDHDSEVIGNSWAWLAYNRRPYESQTL